MNNIHIISIVIIFILPAGKLYFLCSKISSELHLRSRSTPIFLLEPAQFKNQSLFKSVKNVSVLNVAFSKSVPGKKMSVWQNIGKPLSPPPCGFGNRFNRKLNHYSIMDKTRIVGAVKSIPNMVIRCHTAKVNISASSAFRQSRSLIVHFINIF